MSSKIKIHFVHFDDSNIRSSQIFFISYANLLSFVLFSMANVFHSKNSRAETKGTREIILSFMRYSPYEGEGKRYGRLLSETSQCPVTYEWKVGKSRMRVVNANRSSFLRFDAHTGHAPHTPTNFVIFLPRGNYRLTKRSCDDKKTPMFSAPPLIKTQSSPVSPVESMR